MACEKETKLGVDWQTTAVNATNSRFCPKGYVGVARRKCGYNSSAANGKSNASAAFKGHWESPDFTGCSNNIVNDLNKQVSASFCNQPNYFLSLIDQLYMLPRTDENAVPRLLHCQHVCRFGHRQTVATRFYHLVAAQCQHCTDQQQFESQILIRKSGIEQNVVAARRRQRCA